MNVLWSSCKRDRYFCPILTKFGVARQSFVYVTQYQISLKYLQAGGSALIYAHGRTDMTKVIALRDSCECA